MPTLLSALSPAHTDDGIDHDEGPNCPSHGIPTNGAPCPACLRATPNRTSRLEALSMPAPRQPSGRNPSRARQPEMLAPPRDQLRQPMIFQPDGFLAAREYA